MVQDYNPKILENTLHFSNSEICFTYDTSGACPLVIKVCRNVAVNGKTYCRDITRDPVTKRIDCISPWHPDPDIC